MTRNERTRDLFEGILDRLSQDGPAVDAAAARLDAADARRLARLSAEGHTGSVCPCCGEKRPLSWVGGSCNQLAPRPGNTEELCGGVYVAGGAS